MTLEAEIINVIEISKLAKGVPRKLVFLKINKKNSINQ